MEQIERLLLKANLIDAPLEADARAACDGLKELVITMGDNFELYDQVSEKFYYFNQSTKNFMMHDPETWLDITGEGTTYDNLMSALICNGFLEKHGTDQKYKLKARNHTRKFLEGEWFEEYTRLAALEAGADAALCSVMVYPNKKIGRKFKEKTDLDVVVRKGNYYLFISNKRRSAYPERENPNRRRNIFQSYKDAARDLNGIRKLIPLDYKVDYALAITSDMVDELHNDRLRYPHMNDYIENRHDLILLSLDHMSWYDYVQKIKHYLETGCPSVA
jgi:hypothetical protein